MEALVLILAIPLGLAIGWASAQVLWHLGVVLVRLLDLLICLGRLAREMVRGRRA